MKSNDAERVAELADRVLDLASAKLCEDYYYQSLTLCIINAVFSISARYTAVQNVVARYCRHFDLKRIRDDWQGVPPLEDQEPISTLLQRYDELGVATFADDVYQNRQRTSARGGILKAEAVQRFSQALRDHRVEYLQDVQSAMDNAGLERSVRAIPGQRSGISLRYLWMLAGSDDLIKPDRMIMRFLRRALSRESTATEAQDLLARAATLLKSKYQQLTPRLLDYKVWEYETAQANTGA